MCVFVFACMDVCFSVVVVVVCVCVCVCVCCCAVHISGAGLIALTKRLFCSVASAIGWLEFAFFFFFFFFYSSPDSSHTLWW